MTVVFASFVLVALPLRILLAAIEIADWTMAWRTVHYVTFPFVKPVELVSPIDRNLIGEAMLTEVLALMIFGALAVYLLALLTVRRHR